MSANAPDSQYIQYVATIKTELDMSSSKRFEEFLQKYRPPSPCPCLSAECGGEYKNDLQKYFMRFTNTK
jgi:hypothetical protein